MPLEDVACSRSIFTVVAEFDSCWDTLYTLKLPCSAGCVPGTNEFDLQLLLRGSIIIIFNETGIRFPELEAFLMFLSAVFIQVLVKVWSAKCSQGMTIL